MNAKPRLEILPQPDDTTCGPTCLHAVYRFHGEDISLDQVVSEISVLEEGGTLAVFLGCHAMRRGYGARLYTYNLNVFDPTWFEFDATDLRAKLVAQRDEKHDPKLQASTEGYLEFLSLGGTIRLEDLTTRLIRMHLKRGQPILTGLSATYLYRMAREFGPDCDPDDVRGAPVGHFVVLCGYEPESRTVVVADPLDPNPLSTDHVYSVAIDRVIGAILLGVITYDANLLVLEPPRRRRGH